MHVHNAKLEHASLCEPILKFDIVFELLSKQKNQVSHQGVWSHQGFQVIKYVNKT